jgi:hypothetical protein
MPSIMNIDMQSDTFGDLKRDMGIGINALLRNMQEYGVDEASMTVKLTILLSDYSVEKNGQSRPATKPIFKHKVSYTVQAKNEIEGKLYGDFALESNGNGMYQLVPMSEQLRMT